MALTELHKNLEGNDLHAIGYIQNTDPGSIGAGKAWLDTTTDPYVLKIRNSADTGWVNLAGVLDAADLTYTASTPANWTGGVDPGDTADALDQLASRLTSEVVLLNGKSGGQIITGGTQASEDLTLISTSHGTKGDIYFGSAGALGTINSNGQLQLPTTGVNGGVLIGGDVLLYRSGANVLMVPDAINLGITNTTSLAVTGSSTFTDSVSTANIKFTNTSAAVNSYLMTWLKSRGAAAANNGDIISDLSFNFLNSTPAEVQSGILRTEVVSNTASSETIRQSLLAMVSGTLREHYRFDGNGATFNEGGIAALDFRIEGDTLTHLLFLDSSVDSIGINTNAPPTEAKLSVNGAFGVADGITAPSAVVGWAFIYVDTSDGDLKVKFGDGTVKTLATDT